MTPFCAAIDWGTSSFRLWLLSEDGAVLAERQSDEGMMRVASTGFDVVLERHLSELGVSDELPVVMCGMVGARQGWQEAGYLDTPAGLGGLIGHARRLIDAYPRDARILPGIAQRDAAAPDVMRGEETQLLGLVAQGVHSGLVCMPGTHSKWVRLKDGCVESFSTYLTGELFAVLSRHSILSAAMNGASDALPGDPAFLDAAKSATANPQAIANLLFQIRSAQLLGFAPSAEGAARLSGLLIGAELAGALARHGPIEKVALVASGSLGLLYESLLSRQGIAVQLYDAEDAVRRGLLRAARTFWLADERQSHAG